MSGVMDDFLGGSWWLSKNVKDFKVQNRLYISGKENSLNSSCALKVHGPIKELKCYWLDSKDHRKEKYELSLETHAINRLC